MENSQVKLDMEDNRVSVVLAVYNGEKYLRKMLDSVLAQKDVFLNELIIVNDRSADSSEEIIKWYQERHTNVKIITNQTNLGPIASFINGAKAASSKYIAFADQDDIWIDTKLSSSLIQLKKIDCGNKPAVIFTDLAMIDEDDRPLSASFWRLYGIKPAENNFFTVLFANIATGCTMLINRKMLDEFVAMPLEAQMHDHWIALVAMSMGNWAYLNEGTVLYRVHGDSVTDKNEVTFAKKVKNFLNASFSKKSTFLEGYISQAILFKQKYSGQLDQRANKQLDRFIELKNSPGFIKKLNSKFRFLSGKRI